MGKFVITEEDKKHIMGLYYEGTIVPSDNNEYCTPEKKEKYDNLVNNIYPEQLKIAIKWWEDWLSSDITKKKFVENNPTLTNSDSVYETYLKILKEIQISPYGSCSEPPEINDEIAYVNQTDDTKIRMNTNINLDNQIIIDALIHEIQHVLYFYYPINPDVKIDDCFTTKTYKKGLGFQKIKNLFTKNKRQSNNIIGTISKDLQISTESAKKLYDAIISINNEDTGYVGSYTEVLSRIYTVRRMLNIKPSDNITKDMLKPYFEYIINSQNPIEYLSDASSKYYDINLLILYWGYSGFKDIDKLLNGLNQMAFNQNKEGNNYA